jgi:hypothetical protein
MHKRAQIETKIQTELKILAGLESMRKVSHVCLCMPYLQT